MRILVLSLLMIPLAIGCSGGDDEKASADAAKCDESLGITGKFRMGSAEFAIDEQEGDGLTFSTVHKVDIDRYEAGCISDISLKITKGDLGCEINLEFKSTGDSEFALTRLTFSADSFCPGFSDDLEGVYRNTGTVPLSISGLPSQVDMEAGTEEAVCVNNIDLRFDANGTLRPWPFLDDSDITRDFELNLKLTGDHWSEGSTDADCEVTDADADAEADTDTDTDADTMSDNASCNLSGMLCYSFDGPFWPGQDTAGFCDRISTIWEDNGSPAMVYGDGCPSGATGQCPALLMASDADGDPIDGSEVTIYSYGLDVGSGSLICEDWGVTYSER